MEKHIYDESNGLWYTLHGDYYLPELKLPPEDDIQYGKFGLIRLSYLKEEKESYYTILLIQGQLIAHLNEVDREANCNPAN